MQWRLAGDPWWRSDQVVTGIGHRAGNQIQRALDALPQLRTLENRPALLLATPQLVDDHRLDQTLRYREGTYTVEGVQIRLDDGLGIVCMLEPRALLVILAIDGQHTLEQLIDDAGDGLPPDEGDVLTDAVVSAVRQLVALGIMVLEDGA